MGGKGHMSTEESTLLKKPDLKSFMLITFFDIEGMIFTHYVPEGQTINAKYYETVLVKLIRVRIP